MPLIEYNCSQCSNRFEILVGVSQEKEEAACPECGNQEIEPLLSTFSASVSSSSQTPSPGTGPCGTSACPCAN